MKNKKSTKCARRVRLSTTVDTYTMSVFERFINAMAEKGKHVTLGQAIDQAAEMLAVSQLCEASKAG